VNALTEADDGRTMTLQVGDEVSLRLSHGHAWDEPRVEGEGIELAPVNYLVDPGFTEWLISAISPDTSVVVATGTPACAEATDCPPTTVRIEVRVIAR
jgi:hypothetical protein